MIRPTAACIIGIWLHTVGLGYRGTSFAVAGSVLYQDFCRVFLKGRAFRRAVAGTARWL